MTTRSPRRRARSGRLWSFLLAVASLGQIAGPAHAFGNEGHQVVALIAQQHLTPEASAVVTSIIALEPGASLASISNWADETRDRSTAAWHYVNLPRGSDCAYQPSRDCPDGNCVVAALTVQAQRLAVPTSSAQDRLEALKYVIHFVADLHQPLHAGFADDRGGNTYQLRAFGRGTNLHAVWDTALLQAIEPDAATLAAVLSARAPPSQSLAFAPEVWATESCRIVSRADFYPSRKLDAGYLEIYRPVIEDRLLLAGLRLAALLNTIASGRLR
jgi:hypothetical protein